LVAGSMQIGLRAQPAEQSLIRASLRIRQAQSPASAQSFSLPWSTTHVPRGKERDAVCRRRNSWSQGRGLGRGAGTFAVAGVLVRAAAVTTIAGRGFGSGISLEAAIAVPPTGTF
jgi:hypothetical protein